MAEKKTKKVQEEATLHSFQGTKMERLKQLWEQYWYGCSRCILHTFRRGDNGEPFPDIVFGDGNPDAKIMIVGEAPGAEEDVCGIPFVGPAGKLLNQILASVSDDPGIQELYKWYSSIRHTKENIDHFHEKMLEWRRQEFFITNTVACRPPDNRTPTHPEVKACWERLLNIIDIVDPWLIIASGKSAVEVLVHRQIEITKKHGEIFDVEIPGHLTTYKKPVMATLHPSYLLRQADWKNKKGSFMQTVHDYLQAMRFVDGLKLHHLGTPIPKRLEYL
jgi:uracil-DNA glycosylase family 4